MLIQEIHALLQGRFGEAVAPLEQPKAGDAFIAVQPGRFRAVAEFLRNDPQLSFDFLRLLTGVDYTARLSSVYHLYSYKHQHALVIKVDLDRAAPKIASVTDLWPTADWLEREAYDMLGIVYEGHPDLRRILLPADWEGFPLRKDYKLPQSYHGIKHNE